ADLLEAHSIAVWIDRKSIAGGTSWSAEIVRGIEGCAALIVLCSKASMTSPNVQQELQLAWDSRRPILPLLLEPVHLSEVLRYVLAGRQWVEILDRSEDAWVPSVVGALRGLGASRTAALSASVPPPAVPILPPTLPSRQVSHVPVPLTQIVGR